ncbi:MAG: outer membrane beta-barrel protein [Candidatus Zixiibacteriota bacterium]
MKRTCVVGIGLLLAMSLPLPVAAVERGELLIGVSGGWSTPVGDYPTTDFGDKVKGGVGFGAAVDKLVTDRISVGGEFGASFNPFDQDFIADSLKTGSRYTPDYKWRTMYAGARGRYYLNLLGNVNFFAQLGIGAYINKFTSNLNWDRQNGVVTPIEKSDTRTDIGMSFGPGALIRVSQHGRLSVQAIFNNVFTSGQSLRFAGLGAGLTFQIPTQ